MNPFTKMSRSRGEDARLVEAVRKGDRDAYGEIVARYQGLICSLAYSGTGSFARSEDIAQDTFVTAWKRLCELRDPSSLRAWLCGIARNLIRNEHRRSAREPASSGEELEPARDIASAEALPSAQAIRAEEEAILWGALGRIPETYREPLILYYRHHQSVTEVAAELGLTEDAAKQRLARGRALLHEQVLAFVEGALERTGPGPSFTNGVMSALPIVGSSIAAAVGAPAAKTSHLAKGASSAVGFGFGIVVALFAALAAWTGWQMADSERQSPAERRAVDRFWHLVVVGFAAFIVPALALTLVWSNSAWVRTALTWWLGAGYVLLGMALAAWAWHNHVRIRGGRTETRAGMPSRRFMAGWVTLLVAGIGGAMKFGFPSGYWTDVWLTLVFAMLGLPVAVRMGAWWERRHPPVVAPVSGAPRRSLRWVAVATVAMAVLLGLSLFDMKGWRSERISAPAAIDLIATRPDAQVSVLEYQNGRKSLAMLVPARDPAGKPVRYFAPLDATTLRALKAKGAAYQTRRQGEDFEILGWPGRLLVVLAFVVVIAGIVVLVRGLRTSRPVA